MVRRLRGGLAFLSGLLALSLMFPDGTKAGDYVFPGNGPVSASSPCSTTVEVPIRGTLSTPCRAVHFAYRVVDELPLVYASKSRFTGRFTRGEDVPESLIESLVVALSPDSTIARITLATNAPFATGFNAFLLNLELHSEVRHYLVSLSFYPDTLLDGTDGVLIDTLNVALPLEVQWGWFGTVFDEPYPPPPEAVYGSHHDVKRSRADTTVTMWISYFAWEPYESISIPIRIKTSGVSAYIVPGSIITTEWAGPNNHLDFSLLPFPDSTGFWLQLFGGPRSYSFWQPYSAKPIVQFDVAISGPGLGVVVADTALILGGRPLEYVDSCLNSYLPQFGRGLVNVGVVGVQSEETLVPAALELLNPYPNPFNGSTTIGVRLAEPTAVHIEIVNLLGQEVATLWEGDLSAGLHEFVWAASEAASGLYLVRAQSAANLRTAKLLFLK